MDDKESPRVPLARHLETWCWVLIYAGLLLGGVGVAVRRQGGSAGDWVLAVGAALAVLGIVMIWARSRLKGLP